MDNRLAIIDLGSNTFHLMIVEVLNDRSTSVLYKERIFVGLSENGIDQLSDAVMLRGIEAIGKFQIKINEYHVTHTSTTGTSALRTASNGDVFIKSVYDTYNIKIDKIDGAREAELIYKGVRQIIDLSGKTSVIMDVGGGSIEFIIVTDNVVSWSRSYDLGIGVLYSAYKIDDPISERQASDIKRELKDKLSELNDQLTNIESTDSLIGASGSFEVVQSMNGIPLSPDKATTVTLDDYHAISQRLIASTLAERANMEGLPASRIKLIVVAMLLIDVAIDIISPKNLVISPYALKEGVLSEMLGNQQSIR